MKTLYSLFNRTYATKVFIFFNDIFICLFAYCSAVLLRFNLEIPHDIVVQLPVTLAVVVSVRALSFYYFKTYSGIIRYAGVHDVLRIVGAVLVSEIPLLIFSLLNIINGYYYSYSIALIDYVLVIFLLLSYRIALVAFYRYAQSYLSANQSELTNIIIYGASSEGLVTKRTLEGDKLFNYKVVAFFDNKPNLIGKMLDGVRVYHITHLSEIQKRYHVEKAIFAVQEELPDLKNVFVDSCLELGLAVMKVPPIEQWLHGKFQARQLQDIRIEELLNREPISLDSQPIKEHLTGKKVLVTGAAGSIGRELVRQIAYANPKQLILLDKSESPLHELHLAVEEEYEYNRVVPILADVANQSRLEQVFETYRPDIVYHAAAYKHVPMLEKHPYEAVKNNIVGTKNVADLAVKYKCQKFVLVSTDKAVNPTNVMGASKRIAEIYVQTLSQHIAQAGNQKTKFTITRFGNVLGSDGSVIPRFYKQIQAGGPITVTSPDITRYFMTIPEACQLILEASTMGKSGEIFIFDMGKSVKIVDLAHKMIRLAGLVPNQDIKIEFTGLRPGEKIEEELLNNSENVIPTYNKKIMIAKDQSTHTFYEIGVHFDELITYLNSRNDMAMVKKMKAIAPEFVSNNSRFEELDKPKTQAKLLAR